jgi:hypothetical protein
MSKQMVQELKNKEYPMIILPDKTKVKLLEPTSKIFASILDLKNLKGDKIVEVIDKLSNDILNNNAENIRVDIAPLSLQMRYEVIEIYSKSVIDNF